MDQRAVVLKLRIDSSLETHIMAAVVIPPCSSLDDLVNDLKKDILVKGQIPSLVDNVKDDLAEVMEGVVPNYSPTFAAYTRLSKMLEAYGEIVKNFGESDKFKATIEMIELVAYSKMNIGLVDAFPATSGVSGRTMAKTFEKQTMIKPIIDHVIEDWTDTKAVLEKAFEFSDVALDSNYDYGELTLQFHEMRRLILFHKVMSPIRLELELWFRGVEAKEELNMSDVAEFDKKSRCYETKGADDAIDVDPHHREVVVALRETLLSDSTFKELWFVQKNFRNENDSCSLEYFQNRATELLWCFLSPLFPDLEKPSKKDREAMVESATISSPRRNVFNLKLLKSKGIKTKKTFTKRYYDPSKMQLKKVSRKTGRKNPFSDEEKRDLVKGHMTYGNQYQVWSLMQNDARFNFNNRTNVNLKDFYRTMTTLKPGQTVSEFDRIKNEVSERMQGLVASKINRIDFSSSDESCV